MPRRTFTKAQGYRAIDLLHAASDHMFSANVLFSSGDFFRVVGVMDVDFEAPRCLDSAGYLCHLGIELLLKAILLNQTESFPNEHSLKKLLAILEENGVGPSLETDHIAVVDQLDAFYNLRYPQPTGSSSIGDLQWTEIHSLFSIIAESLPDGLKRDLMNLDRTAKFGRKLMKKPKESGLFEGHVLVVPSKE
ncbi:MAG: HEPN domain-containing protein [Candidatus Binataceae bacterium]